MFGLPTPLNPSIISINLSYSLGERIQSEISSFQFLIITYVLLKITLEPNHSTTANLPLTCVLTGGEGDLAGALKIELKSQGWEVFAPSRAELDVTNPNSIRTFFGTLPKLDMLVTCAGVLHDALVSKLTDAQWNACCDVNLTGAFRCAQAAAPLMSPSIGGSVVFISSGSAKFGNRGQANYAASKAGLIALAQSLAREWGQDNIRVHCILPGFLTTHMTAHLHRNAEDHTLKRFNTVQETARFIAFLHSLRHTSGQVFQLDSRIGRFL